VPDWVAAYQALPHPLRIMAANVRGGYLRWWRYGPETESLVQRALDREGWNPGQWQGWQEDQLARLLDRAARKVPFYRRHWEERRRSGDRTSWSCLENWPILEKQAVRQTPKAFLADDCRIGRLFPEQTSGTTGTPIRLWWSGPAVRHWYALFEARGRRWHNVSRKQRWAILGGQRIVPVEQRRPPFWIWNEALRQLYLSSYHLAPDLIPFYLKALRDYRVSHLVGYTSSLYSLALEMNRTESRDLGLTVVLSNAEPVYPHQREAIERAFQCPLRETYGLAEIVTGASECPQGRLHLWPEAGVLEILDDQERLNPTGAGELVATGLLNEAMPLIRYRTGDWGRVTPPSEPCNCGRTLPLLQELQGREDDLLLTADKRRVGRLDLIFKTNLPIREAQIIQERWNEIRVRVVPAQAFRPEDAARIVQRVQAYLTPSVRVVVETVTAIPRTAAGKFRAVVCNLPREAGDLR
jgi:phenylacetate-CoA ligase